MVTQTPSISPVEPAGQVFSPEVRDSPNLFDGQSTKMKIRSLSTRQVLRRDTLSSSSDQMSRLQQDKHRLMEEVKAQKVISYIAIR